MSGVVNSTDYRDELDGLESDASDLEETLDKAREQLAFAELNHTDDAAARERVADLEQEQKEWKEENDARVKELGELLNEVGDHVDMIPVGDFTDYVEEMLQDNGDIPNGFPDYIVIDWQATAENIMVDYSNVTFEGTDYLYRN